MSDLMSLGIPRLWKRHFVATCGIRPGQSLLDLAGGTGDIARLARARGAAVTTDDINLDMLATGRERMDNAGLAKEIERRQVSAEPLTFASRDLDHPTIALALRNV